MQIQSENKLNASSFGYEEVKKSTLKVFIYYDDLKYTHIQQEIKIQTWDLVSALGETLSLFLGVSFLIFFEIVQIILEIFFLCFESKSTSLV